MNNTNNTTPTINGLRLVSPEEAGVQKELNNGHWIHTVLLKDDKPYWCFNNVSTFTAEGLIPLPKPRTTRPYKRGEVRLCDGFRGPAGSDFAVTRIAEDGVFFGTGFVSWETLLANYQRLTYDSEGREVLSEAGQTEEQS